LLVASASPYEPTLTVSPPLPTSNDLVTLGLGVVFDDCMEPLPEFRAVRVTDPSTGPAGAEPGRIDLVLERVVAGVPCEPGLARAGAVVAPVGDLEPGLFDVQVHLRTVFAPAPPDSATSAVRLGPDRVASRPRAEVLAGALTGDEELIGRFDLGVGVGPDGVLLQERFEVTASWWLAEPSGDQVQAAQPVPRSSADSTESALFGFYSTDNWELLIKVLDGCNLNGHFWVYGAAATDLGYRIQIRDLMSGALWVYENPLGQASPAITDVEALAACSP
jgi:hypothetical protein